MKYTHGNTSKKQLTLNFTVFWGTDSLTVILDELDRYGVKADFFIGGSWAVQFPDILKDISDRGHEICLHGYTHVDSTELTRGELIDNIVKDDNLVFGITGKRTRIFMPPSGRADESVLETVSSIYFRTVTWNIDSIDWRDNNEEIIYNRVMSQLSPGGFILFHPQYGTTKALPRVIEDARARGYTFVTASESLGWQ